MFPAPSRHGLDLLPARLRGGAPPPTTGLARIPAARGLGRALVGASLLSAGGLAWCGSLGSVHSVPLPAAVSGERREIDGAAGRIAYTRAGPDGDGIPLLLLHSVNAAASAYEVRPLYEHYRRQRPVYAPDLPGFGHSDRSDRPYLPRLMTDAVHAMVAEIRRLHGAGPIDALAVSLSSEFLARAAMEDPGAFRTIALLSPTGLDRRGPRYGEPGRTRGRPGLYRFFSLPGIGKPFFRVLTTRPSMRYFLRKTWGGPDIDEGLLEYGHASARQPGAYRAPLRFLTGFLFSDDITRVYESLDQPVWVAHGVRGDFVDYSGTAAFESRPNWTLRVFETGAMPHFEMLEVVVRDYDAFLDRARDTPPGAGKPLGGRR
jgi:pimeloyl-ACP methyl ester carboxylesterase